MQDNLLLVGIVGFAGGILLCALLSISFPVILFLLLLSAGFFLAWFFGRRDVYLIPSVLLLLIALGSARVLVSPQTFPATFTALLGTPSTLTGTIVADPDIRETTQRVIVKVAQGKDSMRILAVADRYPQLAYGEEVQVHGTLLRPMPFATDGGREFRYDAFLAKDGIFLIEQRSSISLRAEPTNILTKTIGYLYAGKHAFVHALEAALPEPEASLAEGLIAGGKQGLGKNLLDAFTIAGLLPIIVLSGYNVMIVAEAILVLCAPLPKRFALLIAGITVSVFVLAAGGGSSALRAALMAGLALFARATGRTYDALRALGFAFILMLLINPLLLANDPGFQFSFAATLGLILASPLFELRLMRIKNAVLRDVLATTLSAQLFVLPLLLYQTGNLSLIAVPANMLVLPVVPLAMALSAGAGVISLIVAPIAPYVGLPAYVVLTYITRVAEYGARLPFAHAIIPAFPFWVLIVPYASIAWLVYVLKKKTQATSAGVSHPSNVATRLRR